MEHNFIMINSYDNIIKINYHNIFEVSYYWWHDPSITLLKTLEH